MSETRNLTVQIGADISQAERGLNRFADSLTRFGATAARIGQEFARSISNGTNAAVAAISRFASQSNAALASFYERQDRNRENFEKGWGRMATSMESIGKRLTVAITAPLILLAAQSFKTYGELDGLQRGLVAVMGSAQAAGRELTNLRQVSALPGLGMREAIQGSIRLQAVGFAADQARKILLEFGNAIATTGGGKSELNQVTVQLGQLAAKGTVLSQDLRPIIEAAPKVSTALQNIFGTIDPEAISGKLAAAGKDSKYFIDLLVTELSKLDRVTGGPKNAVENLSDSLAQAQTTFMGAADQALNLTGKIDKLGSVAVRISEGFADLSPEARATALAITGIAIATGPMLVGLGSAIKLVQTLTASTGALTVGLDGVKAGFAFLATPIGATVVAITATVGALATLGYSIQHYDESLVDAVDTNRLFRQVQLQSADAISKEITQLNNLLSVARDETVSRKTRLQAVKDINAISPQYLGNISLETINTQEAAKAIFGYTNALTLKAKAQILAQRAAEASLKVDKIDAQPITDFVDKNRFSADQIAVNIKTSASFNREEDAAKLFKELGEKRKREAKKAAEDEANFYNDQLKKAYLDASKKGITIGETPAKPPAIDFKNLSGTSLVEQLKDEVKKAKDAVASFKIKNPGAKVPIELELELKNKSKLLKDATDAVKELTPGGTPKISVKAEVFGDEASLKRLESWLESQIQIKGGKGAEQEMQWLASVRGQLEKVQAITSKDQKLNITGIKEIASNSKAVDKIVDDFLELKRINPGLFADTGIKDFLDKIQLAGPSLDYYRNKIAEVLNTIAQASLPGVKIDPKILDELKKLLAELKKAYKEATDAAAEADASTNTGASGEDDKKWLEKAKQRIKEMKDAGEEVKQSAEEIAQGMKAAHDSLMQEGANMLEGIGEAIGKGQNPLKAVLQSVLSMLGDFMIKIGTALLIGGPLLAAAEVAFPFLAPFLKLKGPMATVAGAALVVGGGTVKGIAGSFENGALFTGESFIRVGESSKARKGGGEWVAPVDKGANLIAKQLVNMGAIGINAAASTASAPSQAPMTFVLDGQLSTSIAGSDLLLAMERAVMKANSLGAYTRSFTAR